MHESPSVPSSVSEQFAILTDNIKTLTEIRHGLSGPVAEQVDKEMLDQLGALGELRERVFNGTVCGSLIQPLERPPARVEILDLSDVIPQRSTAMLHEQLSH